MELTLSMELVGPCAYLKLLFTKCFQTASLLGDRGFSRRGVGGPLLSTEWKMKQTLLPHPIKGQSLSSGQQGLSRHSVKTTGMTDLIGQ